METHTFAECIALAHTIAGELQGFRYLTGWETTKIKRRSVSTPITKEVRIWACQNSVRFELCYTREYVVIPINYNGKPVGIRFHSVPGPNQPRAAFVEWCHGLVATRCERKLQAAISAE